MEHLAKNLEQIGTGKEQFCKGGFLWNNYSREEQHKIGTNRNIKNNVMEHLASNLEQTGTGKGAVLQRRISEEQF